MLHNSKCFKEESVITSIFNIYILKCKEIYIGAEVDKNQKKGELKLHL